MKTLLKILLPFALLAGGLAAKSLLVATGPQSEEREPAAFVPTVEVLVVQPGLAELQVEAQGVVRALRSTALASEVAGLVREVGEGLQTGAFFAEGELLLRIDDTDARIALLGAEARVEQAAAALELERAQAEIARRDWQALGEGEAPPAALRLPQQRAAEATLAVAQASLEKARVDLARCTLRAPFAGRTVQRLAEVGAWIAPGQPVVEVYTTSAAEVVLPLPLDQLEYLALDLDGAVGAPVATTLEAEVGGVTRRWQGVVTRVEAALDPRDRMARAIARVEAPFRGQGSALTPGMFVRATLSGHRVEDVYRVPRYVLRPGDTLLLVDTEDRLHEIQVEVLQRRTEEVLIRGGLSAGDRVCVTPLALVLEGMQVQVGAEAGQ